MAISVKELEDSLVERAEESSEQIEEVVQQLNGICRNSQLEFALRVGSVIIHHFYDGDMDAWRSRGPKLNSFRRLAAHPDLALSAGTLCRCVAIFEMCDRLRAASRWRRLGASHLRIVIGLPPDKQESLLNSANEERWTVQMLQAKAQGLRADRARGGRRAQSALGKQLRMLDRCLHGWDLVLDSVSSHELEELERSMQLLERMKTSVEELVEAVAVQRNRLERAEPPPAQGVAPDAALMMD